MKWKSLCLFLPALVVTATVAAGVNNRNVTVDDFFGDPVTGAQIVYGPSLSFWNIGQICAACTARPNPFECYNQTWHDSTFYPLDYEGPIGPDNEGQIIYANMSFTGSAVYVYTVLAHTSSSPDGASDMTFFIDGKQAGVFAQQPDNSPVYTYNALVYKNDELTFGLHELSIQIGHLNYKSLLMLDYVTYTTQIDEAPPSSTTSTTTQQPSVIPPKTSAPSTTSPAGSTTSQGSSTSSANSTNSATTSTSGARSPLSLQDLGQPGLLGLFLALSLPFAI